MKFARPALLFAAIFVLGLYLLHERAPQSVAALPDASVSGAEAPDTTTSVLEVATDSAASSAAGQSGKTREAVLPISVVTAAGTAKILPAQHPGESPGKIYVWCYAPGDKSLDPAEIVLRSSDGTEQKVHGNTSGPAFRNLAPGRYVIDVRDPGYAPISIPDVEPGSHVLVNLVSNVRVRFQAVDELTSAVVPNESLRLVGIGAPNAEGWFRVPGGDLALQVAAQGYATVEVQLRGLSFGESRELPLKLGRGTRIGGRVLSDVTGLPLRGAQVKLVPEREALERSFDPVGQERGSLHLGTALGAHSNARLTVETGLDGAFSFDDLASGSYALSVTFHGLRGTQLPGLALASGENRKDLLLRCPTPAILEGQLLVHGQHPEPEVCSLLWITLWVEVPTEERFPEATDELRLMRMPAATTNVEPDGKFRLENLAPGRIQVALAVRNAYERSAIAPSRSLELLEFTSGGTLRREYEIAELLPGTASISVRREGHAVQQALVLLARRDDSTVAVATHAVDDEGVAEVSLLPGDYAVTATDPVSGWIAGRAQSLRIEPGATAAGLTFDATPIEGMMTLPEAGEARFDVSLCREVSDWPGRRVENMCGSVPGGKRQLALEPGTYDVGWHTTYSDRKQFRMFSGTLVWTANGPAADVAVRAANR